MQRVACGVVLACLTAAGFLWHGRAAAEEKAAAANGRVHGVVLDAEGAPAAGARVRVWAPASGCEETHDSVRVCFAPTGQFREVGSALTDAQGRWSVSNLEPTQFYSVSASGPGGRVAVRTYASAGAVLRHPVRLHLRPSRRLHGRVVDEQGLGRPGFVSVAAWSGSNVWGSSGPGVQPLARQVATAPDGRFAVNVFVGMHARIDAHVPGVGAAGEVVLDGAGADPAHAVEIPVRHAGGSAVEGTVRDDRGTPVAGARVIVQTGVARPWDAGPGMSGYATTDADGRYRVRHLAGAVIVSIAVSATDYVFERLPHPVRAPLTGTPLTPDRPFLADVVLQRARTIRGRVFDADGKPLAGAWVGFTSGDGSWVPRHTQSGRSDAKGRFEIWNVPPGPVRVYAGTDAQSVAVYATGGTAGVLVAAGEPGEVQRVRLDVQRGLTLSGSLQDKAGKPVSGARLSLYESPPMGGSIRTLSAWSGADGRFFIEGIRGGDLYYEIQVDAPGFVQTRTRIARGASALAAPLVVVIERGGSVSGTVVDGDDKPLVGVSVWCEDVNNRTTTDAQGHFTLDGVQPGRRLLACGPPGVVGAQRTVDVVAGGTVADQTLRLPTRNTGTAVIGGIVVDAEGAPVVGEPVTITAVPPGTGWKTVRTGEDGRFLATHVPPGRYTLSPGRPQGRPPVVAAGSTDTRLVVEGRRINMIEGVVVAGSGKPVPNGYLELAFVGDGANTVRGGTSLFGGRFRVGVPVGVKKVVLRVKQPADGLRRPLNLMEMTTAELKVGSEPVRIELPQAFTIRGVVHDVEGRGVGHIKLTAVPADRPRHDYRPGVSALCDAQGRFTFIGLADRAYRITTVPAVGYAPSTEVRAQAGATDVHIPVERYRRFFGRVVDDTGAPVEGVTISAMGKHRSEGMAIQYRPGQKSSFHAKTDDDGRFALESMPPHMLWDIWFHWPIDIKPLFFPVRLERHTPSGKAHDVKLRRGLPIAGRLTTPSGEGVKGVTVDTRGPPGKDGKYDPELRRQAYTQPDGRFVVGPFPEGAKVTLRFDLRVVRGQKPLPWLDATQEGVAAGTQDLAVVLSTGVELRGRVTGATPEELKSVSLSLTSAGTPTAAKRAIHRHYRFDGTTTEFGFYGLEPGAYVLTAGGSREVQLPQKTEVQAPAKDIVLVRRVSVTLRGTLVGVKDPRSYSAVFHETGGRRRSRPVQVKADWSFDLGAHYNNPGVLVITGRARSHVVYMQLTPSKKPVVAKAVKTKTIRGRIHGLPHKISGGRAFVREGPVTFTGTVADDGWFEIRGLPPGKWNVTITASRPTGGTFEVKNPIQAGKHNVRVHWR